VTDPAEHERLSRTGPLSWVVTENWIFLRIEAEMVTGREIIGMPSTG
jgi:hypothetical protein